MHNLPDWIRLTPYCPLKLANQREIPVIPRLYHRKIAELRAKYPNFMRPILGKAARFAAKEFAERREFLFALRDLPESVREKIDVSAYETRETRRTAYERIQAMLLNPPALSTFGGKPAKYHKAKAFKQPMPETPKGFYPRREHGTRRIY
ncbi:hypothetical protein V9W64_10720 [Neisseria leonii]|uniref:Uncharacterized protein n=1 Tax=Neisseria leonii TaxID=2995413 RepID=A0A9X4E6Q8_9NEIS|nr:hypothetical protein [Neisseria sp. 51.81]MDD9328801.1 hypothetical protein [Neisseria sp. 51.81]